MNVERWDRMQVRAKPYWKDLRSRVRQHHLHLHQQRACNRLCGRYRSPRGGRYRTGHYIADCNSLANGTLPANGNVFRPHGYY